MAVFIVDKDKYFMVGDMSCHKIVESGEGSFEIVGRGAVDPNRGCYAYVDLLVGGKRCRFSGQALQKLGHIEGDE